ncbi:MAG: hypothetical protein ABI045_01530 [Flavobacteriales bacterium]
MEIFIGQVIDTNSSFIVQKFAEVGIETRDITTVHAMIRNSS